MSTERTPSHPAQGNESKIRITAFGVVLLVVAYWLSGSVWIPALLAVDFALRSFNKGRWSPLATTASWVVQLLGLRGKPVYMPPKRFAARIGLLFSIVILIFHLSALPVFAQAVSAVLAFFAALESLVGFCAGCYVYNFLQRFRRQHT